MTAPTTSTTARSASRLKRVSEDTERRVAALAEREGRTFIAQLDRVVLAGLQALGEVEPQPTTTARPRNRR